MKVLQNLEANKAVGCDLIPPKILKLFAEELAPSMTNIFNLIQIFARSLNMPHRFEADYLASEM